MTASVFIAHKRPFGTPWQAPTPDESARDMRLHYMRLSQQCRREGDAYYAADAMRDALYWHDIVMGRGADAAWERQQARRSAYLGELH